MNVDELIDCMKISHDISDNNICDILKGVPQDKLWLINRMRIAKNTDTILGMYFNHVAVRSKLEQPGYNPGVLKLCIQRYIDKYNPPLPEPNECCVYFRMGDVMFDPKKKNPTDYNYIDLIATVPHDIITIVCNISFHVTKDVWKSTPDKIDINKQVMRNIIENIHKNYPHSKIKMYSNDNPDLDICYLFKNGFVGHPDSSWKQMFGRL